MKFVKQHFNQQCVMSDEPSLFALTAYFFPGGLERPLFPNSPNLKICINSCNPIPPPNIQKV